MKYETKTDDLNRRSLFIVTIEDTEFTNLDSNSKIRQFEYIILSRLASIIVGYLFKHHKDELLKPILNNVVEKVSKEVSREILSRLGLPLEGSYDTKN